jgi:hypothetical protein
MWQVILYVRHKWRHNDMNTNIPYNDATTEFNQRIWRYERDVTPCNRYITRDIWEQADKQELIELASKHLWVNQLGPAHVRARPVIEAAKIEILTTGVWFSGIATCNLLKYQRHWIEEDNNWIPWTFFTDLKELRSGLEQQTNYDEALEYLVSIGCRKVWWNNIDYRSALVSYKDAYQIRISEHNGELSISCPA